MKLPSSVKKEESPNEEAKYYNSSAKSEPDQAGGYGRGKEEPTCPQEVTNGYHHGMEAKERPHTPPPPDQHPAGAAPPENSKAQRTMNGAEIYQQHRRAYSPTSPKNGQFPTGLRSTVPGEEPVRRLHLSDIDEQHRAQSPSKKPGYCVDELCSCGMHKCIPSRPPLPFEGDSVYRREYGPKPLAPPVPPQEVKLPPSLPFEAESSYRTEYGPKPLPPAVKPVEVKRPPSLPFSGESAYRQDYGPKPLPPPQKPVEVKLPPSLPFEADSSYRCVCCQRAPAAILSDVNTTFFPSRDAVDCAFHRLLHPRVNALPGATRWWNILYESCVAFLITIVTFASVKNPDLWIT